MGNTTLLVPFLVPRTVRVSERGGWAPAQPTPPEGLELERAKGIEPSTIGLGIGMAVRSGPSLPPRIRVQLFLHSGLGSDSGVALDDHWWPL
jgi:hypothetical protein